MAKMREEQEKRIESMSLSQKVNAMADYIGLSKKLEREKNKKKFKLPWGKKLNKGQLKKNYCLVFFLRNNLQLILEKVPIEDDMIYYKKTDTYHLVTANYVWRYENYPAILLPEWSLEPISPEMLRRKALDDKQIAYPQKILINALKKGTIKPKGGLPGSILLYIILGIVAIYLIGTVITGGKIG